MHLCVYSENDTTGKVYALLFQPADKLLFQLSAMVIGHGLLIVKPQLDGVWAGLKIFTSSEPCLINAPNMELHLQYPFPDKVTILKSIDMCGNNYVYFC